MAKPITPPKPGESKDFLLAVGADVAHDLFVYCEALPAQWTKVINRAVRELIDRDLEENRGFRERFDRLKDRLVEEDRRARQATQDSLRLIQGRKPKAASERPKGGPNSGPRRR